MTQAATTNLPPGEVVGFRFANIAGIATVSFDDQTRFVLAYQWFLPDHQIVRDGGLTDDVGPFVFAPLSDPDLTAAGAQVLWINPRVDIALWREPIRQSLARSGSDWLSWCHRRLAGIASSPGPNPIPMLMAKSSDGPMEHAITDVASPVGSAWGLVAPTADPEHVLARGTSRTISSARICGSPEPAPPLCPRNRSYSHRS